MNSLVRVQQMIERADALAACDATIDELFSGLLDLLLEYLDYDCGFVAAPLEIGNGVFRGSCEWFDWPDFDFEEPERYYQKLRSQAADHEVVFQLKSVSRTWGCIKLWRVTGRTSRGLDADTARSIVLP